MNFLFASKLLSSVFLQGSNIYKLSENYTQILLSFLLLLHETGNIFAWCKGDNSYRKSINMYNFRVKSGMWKWSTHWTINVKWGCKKGASVISQIICTGNEKNLKVKCCALKWFILWFSVFFILHHQHTTTKNHLNSHNALVRSIGIH